MDPYHAICVLLVITAQQPGRSRCVLLDSGALLEARHAYRAAMGTRALWRLHQTLRHLLLPPAVLPVAGVMAHNDTIVPTGLTAISLHPQRKPMLASFVLLVMAAQLLNQVMFRPKSAQLDTFVPQALVLFIRSRAPRVLLVLWLAHRIPPLLFRL